MYGGCYPLARLPGGALSWKSTGGGGVAGGDIWCAVGIKLFVAAKSGVVMLKDP